MLALAVVAACGGIFIFFNDIRYLLSPKSDVTIISQDGREVTMVSVLPRDAIPSIDDPRFLSVEEADTAYSHDELVMGVVVDGEARAYSIPFLSRHEIVNDTFPNAHLAVTW